MVGGIHLQTASSWLAWQPQGEVVAVLPSFSWSFCSPDILHLDRQHRLLPLSFSSIIIGPYPLVIFTYMTQIQKKRLHFTRTLQRRERQHQFHLRRMALINQSSQNSSLQQWIKLSLDKNRLLCSQHQRRNVIEKLVAISQSSEIMKEYQSIIAICSNVLIDDDLSLDEKAEFTIMLQKCYEFVKASVKLEKAAWSITYSLRSFISAVPSLHQQQAFQCICLSFELITKLITGIARSSYFDDNKWALIATSLIQALQYLIYCSPEEQYLLPVRISSNLIHLQNIIKADVYLISQRTNTALILREGLLKVFQYITIEVQLCDYPWLFQSQFFLQFVMNEIKSPKTNGVKNQFNKMALHIMGNLFIDFGKGDCEVIITYMTNIDKDFKQLLLKQCLNCDNNIFIHLKTLKTIISIEQLYDYFQQQIQKNWKDIIDLCMSALRQQKPQCYRLSIQSLLILLNLYCGSNTINIPIYLQNIGCQSLFGYLLNSPLPSKELQQEIELIQSGIQQIKSYFRYQH